jgi:uncharacterized protein YbbK (DUF523 family)
MTEDYKMGAQKVLKIARVIGITTAILKSRSPSCGKGEIHDGTFSGGLIQGNGLTAELLIRNGIEVFTEEEL